MRCRTHSDSIGSAAWSLRQQLRQLSELPEQPLLLSWLWQLEQVRVGIIIMTVGRLVSAYEKGSYKLMRMRLPSTHAKCFRL